ncbi:glycosyltransferase family 2 protein [Escherichia coli]
MKISIIIPVYNSSNKILKILNHFNKNDKNFDIEVILIDDFSDDIHKLEVLLKEYPFATLIKCKKKSNAANTRNIGIKNAGGDYIFLLDSDDEFTYDHIEKRIKLHESRDFIYGDFFVCNKNKKKPRNCGDISNKSPCEFLFAKVMGDFRTSTISFTKNIKNKIKFDINQNKHQDWGLLFNIYEKKIPIYYDFSPSVLIHEEESERMSNTLNIEASKYFYKTYLEYSNRKYSNRFVRFLIGNCFYIGNYNQFTEIIKLYKLDYNDLTLFFIFLLYKIKIINNKTYHLLSFLKK